MFYLYQLPLPRLTQGNPYFEAIVPRAVRLICTTEAFASLWQDVTGATWPNAPEPSETSAGGEGSPAADPVERQRLRDELDAFVAHLYGLGRSDFAHILDTFPLVFPNTAAGQAQKEALLHIFDRLAPITQNWPK